MMAMKIFIVPSKPASPGLFAKKCLERGIISSHQTCAWRQTIHPPPQVKRSLAEHDPASDLTPREMEVLQLLIKGLSNKEIGEVLGCTENTAKFHIKNILGKLEVNDRTEAATAAFHRGILH